MRADAAWPGCGGGNAADSDERSGVNSWSAAATAAADDADVAVAFAAAAAAAAAAPPCWD